MATVPVHCIVLSPPNADAHRFPEVVEIEESSLQHPAGISIDLQTGETPDKAPLVGVLHFTVDPLQVEVEARNPMLSSAEFVIWQRMYPDFGYDLKMISRDVVANLPKGEGTEEPAQVLHILILSKIGVGWQVARKEAGGGFTPAPPTDPR